MDNKKLQESIRFEIEKLSPGPKDLICIKLPVEFYESISIDQLKQMRQKVKNDIPDLNVVIVSADIDFEILKESQLEAIGIQLIDLNQ